PGQDGRATGPRRREGRATGRERRVARPLAPHSGHEFGGIGPQADTTVPSGQDAPPWDVRARNVAYAGPQGRLRRPYRSVVAFVTS
ncbi:MAG: hypothetical protein M3Z66_08180, partial [Chloroflexota bacterium]|nr:hypothetical protein [Chloroflexota bacterium]